MAEGLTVSRRHAPIVGWLATADECWPGVQLYRDAFVVDAPLGVLQAPPGDLTVVLGSVARPIAEILVIEESRTSPARATAMIRLVREHGAQRVAVDRTAVIAAWTSAVPLWETLRDMGFVPAQWPDQPVGRPIARVAPSAIAVKTVPAAPADWCTIFWWLC
jgi:hypothetical protein